MAGVSMSRVDYKARSQTYAMVAFICVATVLTWGRKPHERSCLSDMRTRAQMQSNLSQRP